MTYFGISGFTKLWKVHFEIQYNCLFTKIQPAIIKVHQIRYSITQWFMEVHYAQNNCVSKKECKQLSVSPEEQNKFEEWWRAESWDGSVCCAHKRNCACRFEWTEGLPLLTFFKAAQSLCIFHMWTPAESRTNSSGSKLEIKHHSAKLPECFIRKKACPKASSIQLHFHLEF